MVALFLAVLVMMVHCAMTKAYLRREIKRHGAAAVLVLPAGATDADALAAIDADPRELFVLGACDNRRADGGCAGHESADQAPVLLTTEQARAWGAVVTTLPEGS